MTVIKQTALSGFDFDGTPGRGFIDLAGTSQFRIESNNESRRFVIGGVAINCAAGTLPTIRFVLALNKADADGIDHFSYTVENTNAMSEFSLRGPVLVPNGWSLFVYNTHAGPPGDCRLLVSGGVITRSAGFNF